MALLDSIQFVVDAEGKRSAVLVDLVLWEEILILLEDAEDAREIQLAREAEEETVAWAQVKTDLGLGRQE